MFQKFVNSPPTKTKASYTTRKIRVVCEPKTSKLSTTQPKTEMDSQFAQAVQCLVAERDRVFVERISAEYNLPLEELKAKYLECAESAIKVPRKYKKRDPTSVTVVSTKEPKATKGCCTAQTSKKEPCKFSALKGEVFCKRHLKASIGAGEEVVGPSEPKKIVPKKVKRIVPEHTHPLDAADSSCNLCTSHGNPFVEMEQTFEVVKVAPTVSERLAALLEESEDDVAVEAEEEYEDDD